MKLSKNNLLVWGKNYSNWLPIVEWSGWILITIILAKLFWVIALHLTSPDVSKQKALFGGSQNKSVRSQSVDISSLVNLHLFGNAEVAPKVEAEIMDLPPTKLNLKLRGIYAAASNLRSNSIIEDGKGKQNVYFIGDKLKVSGRVYLRQVYVDRVILETNGTKEELRLVDSLPTSKNKRKQSRNKKSKSGNRVDDKRKNQQISRSLNKYRKQFNEDPTSLIGLVNYRPEIADGEMVGIKISPGKDKRLFTQLGLRRNDVITSINGVSLSNTQDAMQLMQELQSMQELQVEINRGNETVSLLLNLNSNEEHRERGSRFDDESRFNRERRVEKNLDRSGI